MNQSTIEYLNTFPTDIKNLDITYHFGDKNLVVGLLDLSRFTDLESLHCCNNQISVLTSIPITIKYIWCRGNCMMSLHLTKEHTNLVELHCRLNRITSLEIPNSIVKLDCSENQLTSLVINSNNIYHVDCSKNSLTRLKINASEAENDVKLCCCNNPLDIIELSQSVIPFGSHHNRYCNSYITYNAANGIYFPDEFNDYFWNENENNTVEN